MLKRDCILFEETDSINEVLDHVLQFKGEVKKVNNKSSDYNLYILVHNDSGFDSYLVLNNIPQLMTIVSLIKNWSAFVFFKIFNGYVDQNKKFRNLFIFYVEEFILIFRWKKICFFINYNQVYLKKKWIKTQFMETIGKTKNMNGYLIFETICYQLVSVMLGMVKG